MLRDVFLKRVVVIARPIKTEPGTLGCGLGAECFAGQRAKSSRPSFLLFAVIIFVETVRDILCDGWRFRLGDWLAICSQ
jgi:hypothetical protein